MNTRGRGHMTLSPKRVGQRSVPFLALVASRVEIVQSVLGHLVIARAETEFGRSHARDVATVAGNGRFRQLFSCLCMQENNKITV